MGHLEDTPPPPFSRRIPNFWQSAPIQKDCSFRASHQVFKARHYSKTHFLSTSYLRKRTHFLIHSKNTWHRIARFDANSTSISPKSNGQTPEPLDEHLKRTIILTKRRGGWTHILNDKVQEVESFQWTGRVLFRVHFNEENQFWRSFGRQPR